MSLQLALIGIWKCCRDNPIFWQILWYALLFFFLPDMFFLLTIFKCTKTVKSLQTRNNGFISIYIGFVWKRNVYSVCEVTCSAFLHAVILEISYLELHFHRALLLCKKAWRTSTVARPFLFAFGGWFPYPHQAGLWDVLPSAVSLMSVEVSN